MTFLKKLGCVISASAFIACSCLPIAADQLTEESASAEVTAKYSAGTVSDVYSVDIEWGSMDFEYKDESRVWNPETHKYDVTESSYWTCDEGADEVKVTNHSNKPVTVELSYTSAEGYMGISGTFDVTSKTLEAAAENSSLDSAPSVTSVLTLMGELSKNVSESTVIGTAKVTLKSGASGDVDDDVQSSGFVKITSTMSEYLDYSYTALLAYQGNNKYTAELCTDTVLSADEKPKLEISIDNVIYYLLIEGSGTPMPYDENVNISTTHLESDGDTAKRKAILIEANKKYRLTITLNGDGQSGTAFLEEID